MGVSGLTAKPHIETTEKIGMGKRQEVLSVFEGILVTQSSTLLLGCLYTDPLTF